MGYIAIKTEHSGAKHGRGAYYGRKVEAKKDSNKRRRNYSKLDIKVGVMEDDVKQVTWKPEPTKEVLEWTGKLHSLYTDKFLYSDIQFISLVADMITKIWADGHEEGYSEGYDAAEYDAAYNESRYGE